MKGMKECDVTMTRSIKSKGRRWEVVCDMAEKREGAKGMEGKRREREEKIEKEGKK